MEQLFITLAAISFLLFPLPIAIIIGIAAIAFFIIRCNKKYKAAPPTENSVIVGATGVIFAVAGVGIIAQGNQYLSIACVSFYLMLVAFIGFFIRSYYKDKQEEATQLASIQPSMEELMNAVREEVHSLCQQEIASAGQALTEDFHANANALINTYADYKSPAEIIALVNAEKEKFTKNFQQQTASLRKEYEKKFKLKEQSYQQELNDKLAAAQAEANRANSKRAKEACLQKEAQLKAEFQTAIEAAKQQFAKERQQWEAVQKEAYDNLEKEHQSQLFKLNQKLKDVNEQKLELERRTRASEAELVSVKRILNEQSQATDSTQNTSIADGEIKQKFLEALNQAKEEIDIISPWMNRHVVDNALVNQFMLLLNRGVKIKILYGIGDPSDTNKSNRTADKRSLTTDSTAKFLRDRLGRYSNLSMKRTNTHAKLFLCDDKFYVISSFNILSYDGQGTRGELGEISYNKQQIKYYRQKFFNFE